MIKGNFFHLYLKKIKKREENPPIFNKKFENAF